MHKKDAYNDITYNYLYKIDEQRKKLKILRKGSIEHYKVFNKAYMNENNGLTIIKTSSEESIQ